MSNRTIILRARIHQGLTFLVYICSKKWPYTAHRAVVRSVSSYYQNLGPKKRRSLFNPNHVLATTEKSCSKKKVAFAQIIKGENVILGDFLG